MAKKVKKPISKPKKKGGLKRKKSGNIFTKILVIVFVLIFVAFFVFKFTRPSEVKVNKENTTSQAVDNHQKKDKMDKQDKKEIETKAVEKSITGTWMSTTGGAVLTMKDKAYRLDFMGVDSDPAIIGTYSVDGDLITFVNKKDPCKDVKGLYEVKFNKNEIGFKCKSDDCTKRKATLPTEWEWLDTEE